MPLTSLALTLAELQDRWASVLSQRDDIRENCIVITLAVFAAAFVLTQLLAPKPKFENARPAGLGDFQVPTATEARIQQLIFGKVRNKGPNVVWYGDLQQIPIRNSVKVNLFHSTNITVGFKYYLGMQFGLGRGDVYSTLRKVWIGDDLVWEGNESSGTILIDKPLLFGGDTLGAGGVVGTLRIHNGTQTTANAYLSDFQQATAGSDRTPSYAGLFYCVFEGGYVGNSTSLRPWSFEVQRNPNPLLLDDPVRYVNGHDANPANLIYEFITNTEWGMGQPAADIDEDNLITTALALSAEGNGISMLIDTALESKVFLEEIERQINGKVFLDQTTGLWTTKLVRDDYDIEDVPELTATTNIKSADNFTRGGWLDTSNQVRLYYFDRAADYNERPAFAADQANALLQGGGTTLTMRNVPAEVRFPGIKDADLAAQTAWRVLRTLSYPLAKCSFVVDRSLWALKPCDVVAWTDVALGFSKLPMRITQIDYGNIADGSIKLDCVQDIFKFAEASFAANQDTGWEPPSGDVDPFDDEYVIEAPRAFLTRAADFTGAYADRVATAGAHQSNESSYYIYDRVSPASFVLDGTVIGVTRFGTLTGALNRGAVSGISFNVTCSSAADKSAILAAYTPDLSAVDLGTNLTNLIRIGNELLIVGAMASGTGTTIDLSSVYRQTLDTVQSDHASSTEVWFLNGLGLTDTSFAAGSSVEVKLLPFNRYAAVPIASVTASTVTLDDRLRKPIPPGRIALNTVANDTTSVSLEGTGSGDTTGILLEMIRRDIRATDEVLALTLDAGSSFANFPAANTTDYTVAVYNTTGAPTLLYTTAANNAASQTLRRTEIFTHTDCAIPSSLRVSITAHHIYDGTPQAARYPLIWDFTTTSALTGLFSFGARAGGVPSTTYTAAATGTFTLSIATAMGSGNVQVSVAGGGYANVITFGNTSGTFSASSSDSIVVKHGEPLAGFMTALLLRNPSATAVAYGVCANP